MTQISKIHLLHTTSTRSDADTDGTVYLTITNGGTIHTLNVSDLPHDEREKGRTDHYRIDVLSLNLDDGNADLRFDLKTTSTDGWLPETVFVVAYNIDGQCKLLAADPDWTTSHFVDSPSTPIRNISRSRVAAPGGTLKRIHLFQTTSTVSNAGSDGKIYLDIQQGSKTYSHQLDTSADDFEGNRSGEFVLDVASKNFQVNADLDLELRIESSDGWLPNDIFVFGVTTADKAVLIQAVPSWPTSGWLDKPDTPVRDIQSPYTNAGWRDLASIDQRTYYNIKVIQDNWYVGVENNSYLPGDAVLNQDEANGANQWRFQSIGSGKYLVVNRLSGLALKTNGLTGKITTVYANQAVSDSKCHFALVRKSNKRWKLGWAGSTGYGMKIKGTPKVKAELTLATAEDNFDLIPVRQFLDPEGTKNMPSKSKGGAEEFVEQIALGLGEELAGSAFPGGGTLFATTFGFIFGDGPDLEDLFDKFREDLLNEMREILGDSSRREAINVLESLKTDFLVSYLGNRRAQIGDNANILRLASEAQEIGNDTAAEIARLLPSFDNDGDVIVDAAALALMRATFPVYVTGATQAVLALQEAALITAVHPSADYAPALNTLANRANEFAVKMRKMYPPIVADRISKTKFETVFIPLMPQEYHGKDLKTGALFANLPNGTSSSVRNGILGNYRDTLSFSYEYYLYRYYDVEAQLQAIRATTEARCLAIRNNTDGARDAFLQGVANAPQF